MSPDVEMVCESCHAMTIVREILFRTDGLIEVQCHVCSHAQTYGVSTKK